MRRSAIATALTLTLLTSAASALFDDSIPEHVRRVNDVTNSDTLSPEQKNIEIKKLAASEPTSLEALSRLSEADAWSTAVGIFRATDTPRQLKLKLGRYLMGCSQRKDKNFPVAFPKEYATFLIAEILNGGEAEFCRKLPMDTFTAVSEFVYVTSDFEGHKDIDLAPFKDPRVMDVLIRCLNAPDDVYRDGLGAIGVPDESTGRNVVRQNIPVVLAKFSAVNALEPLRKILNTHDDWYTRNNAAYAVAFLEPPTDHAKTITALRAVKVLKEEHPDRKADRFYHLHAFGMGLLARGDDAGVEFMRFEYSEYNKHNPLYMLQQSVIPLVAVKSPKLDGFFKEVFADARIRDLLLNPETNEWRVRPVFEMMCQAIEANHLAGQKTVIETIATNSNDTTIKQRAKKAAETLAK